MRHRPAEFLDLGGNWKCTACGDCCEHLELQPQLAGLDLDRGDGVCKNLLPDRRCAIYSDRPAGCRVPTPIGAVQQLEQAHACAFMRDLVALDLEDPG